MGIGTRNLRTEVKNRLNVPRKQSDIFVDAYAGSDGAGGDSWESAYKTMNTAFGRVKSGGRIYFVGKLTEHLTTPVQVFDVQVIGGQGTRPRHDDSQPYPDGSAGGTAAKNHANATWAQPSSPTAATPNVKVMQQGWRFENIVFVGPSDAACVLLFRDGGADSDERDASHAEFYNCRFASGQDGIEDSGGSGHVGIYNCFFTDLTGVALKQTTGAGIGQPYFRWHAVDNRFEDCPSLTTAKAAQHFEFRDNIVTFAGAVTVGFDFTSGKQNVVVGNKFNVLAADFDPAGGFTGTATDIWSNTLEDAIESGLPAN